MTRNSNPEICFREQPAGARLYSDPDELASKLRS